MRPIILTGSTDTTVKVSLISADKCAVLVIDQSSKPVYTNPTVAVDLPNEFTGMDAVDMFLIITAVQDGKYEKMLARIGKKPK